MSIVRRGTVAALALTAGIGLAAPAADAAPAVNGGCVAHNTHHLTYKQRGTRITLLPGQCLQLALLTYTDGGASWYTTEHVSRSIARVVSVRVAAAEQTGKTPVAGAPSTTYYLYKRTGAGTTHLRIEQEQFGKPAKGDEVFTLTIRGK